MTDEEKAEEYINTNPKAKLMYCFELDRIIQIKKAYLNGLAEGRKEKMLAYAKNHGKLTKEKIELTEGLKDKDRQLNNWYLSYNEVLKENAELREQIEEMRKCLDKWYSQYGDKGYTECFYKCLLKQTESFLFTDVSTK